MGIVELLLIAVGLSMDAFAVSICKGLGMKKVNMKVAVVLALFFGGFQGLMPLIGWELGSQFLWLIAPIDHWIAFGLLAVIGGKMICLAVSAELVEANKKTRGEHDARSRRPRVSLIKMRQAFCCQSVGRIARVNRATTPSLGH